ncbi:MAG: phosphoribosylformylglycinamidine synthase I [bacterium TMED6]|nr:MAG: phosphoribosylformylglycinamidine synthase I [bacterium TMED6]
MKFAVIVFPGSNCDNDAYYVIRNQLEVEVDFVWHKDSDLSNYDGIIIPGGFSYGDYLRAGAVARFSKIMNAIKLESTKGKAIIGICNGFQILVESGLLPGALITNKSTRFISKEIQLEVSNNESLFTKKYDNQEIITMPIAHKQGNYFADDLLLKELEDNNQIAFKYKNNPNGSCNDIAGIFNKQKNILGMMPHPERAAENILGSKDGVKIFESILSNI